MKICILGSGLSALALAKALVNEKIYVDLLAKKKKLAPIYQEPWEFLKAMLSFLIII